MTASGRLAWSLACIIPLTMPLSAQDVATAISQGRYGEAARVLAEADTATAEAAARAIFARAYREGLQAQDLDEFSRGVLAAESLPSLSSRVREELQFWRGFALFQSTLSEQTPHTVASAEATLPQFRAARSLMQPAEDLPPPFDDFMLGNLSVTRVLANVDTYIQIQEAILLRDRSR